MFELFRLAYNFVAICLFVYLIIILINLFLKSFKPQKTLLFIGVILLLFFTNFFLAYSSLSTTIEAIRKYSGSEPTTIPIQNETPQERKSEELPDIF